jgi:osmotically inducible protein OsmC
MNKIEKVLATGKTHTTFSDGANSSRGLAIELSSPGNPRLAHEFAAIVPHPTAEQFFAGAWSACYTAAVELAAKNMQVTLPPNLAVDIEVDLGQTGPAYFLQARLTLRVPGLTQAVATELAHAADQICPYSKATRGNIDVVINALTA